jgi:hypothetical protein
MEQRFVTVIVAGVKVVVEIPLISCAELGVDANIMKPPLAVAYLDRVATRSLESPVRRGAGCAGDPPRRRTAVVS